MCTISDKTILWALNSSGWYREMACSAVENYSRVLDMAANFVVETTRVNLKPVTLRTRIDKLVREGWLFVDKQGLLRLTDKAYDQFLGCKFVRRSASVARMDAEGVKLKDAGRPVYQGEKGRKKRPEQVVTSCSAHYKLGPKERPLLHRANFVVTPETLVEWEMLEEEQQWQDAQVRAREFDALDHGHQLLGGPCIFFAYENDLVDAGLTT
ncbi:hypothetical protein EOL73_03665 [Candidatus Saccharibacteria bacterium]|nr:hypothetical protein [Candidatus Saccharibacteria bacterium]NCU40826.1 hypothetical protein [Candidatus Saccharibacteria bacterium]